MLTLPQNCPTIVLGDFNVNMLDNKNKNTQNVIQFMSQYKMVFVATPLWPSVGVKPNTCKVVDLESSETPECLELDRKALNTRIQVFLMSLERS
jgi:hypothetical protein